MQFLDLTNAAAEPGSRPGLTSLIRTGRGLMTLQTEITGDPAGLVTIVDFRGRVLETWTSPLSSVLAPSEVTEAIRRWHVEIEALVRERLARATRRRPQARGAGEVVSHLFLAAMQAYGARDFETARALLCACELLLPEDPRVRAGLRRLQPRS